MDNYPDDDTLQPVLPPDLLPEDALEIVIGLCYEMRHPLKKLDTIAAVLSDPYAYELHAGAVQDLRDWIGGLRYILNIIYDYDQHRQETRGHSHEDFF
jgi:two-component SAPR family response regulator